MKAIDLRNHMQETGTWVDWSNTRDCFVAGDPEKEVKHIAVAWQARIPAIKQAVSMGCDMFVTHEPTFFRDREVEVDIMFRQEKIDYVKGTGIVILRCHDTWDQMPEVGIVDSWADHLGLAGKLNSNEFHSVYPAPGSTLRQLASHVAQRTKDLGQDCVEMVGDPDAKASRVAIGCGAITRYDQMIELGADCIIGTDDGMSYWDGGAWALDGGIPLVLVNHCTAEEPGIKNLAAYIGKLFPEVNVSFIPQGCTYRTVA